MVSPNEADICFQERYPLHSRAACQQPSLEISLRSSLLFLIRFVWFTISVKHMWLTFIKLQSLARVSSTWHLRIFSKSTVSSNLRSLLAHTVVWRPKLQLGFEQDMIWFHLSIWSQLYKVLSLPQVWLVGTAPFLEKLYKPLTALRSAQLRRIKAFFNLQTAKCYTSSKGVKKCVWRPTGLVTI